MDFESKLDSVFLRAVGSKSVRWDSDGFERKQGSDFESKLGSKIRPNPIRTDFGLDSESKLEG